MKKWVGGNSLADLHSSLAPSVSVHFSLHRPVAKQPESADIMLLSKWHSSGEKLLQNHTQFKWNWNNNPRLKRSIALSYQTLQRVGCITVLAITETHSAQGLAFNYLCLMHNMDLKNKSIWLKKKKQPQTQIHRQMNHNNTEYSALRLLVRAQEWKTTVFIPMAAITIFTSHVAECET